MDADNIAPGRNWAQQRRHFAYVCEYVALRLIGVLIRLMPIDVASALMGWSWRMVAPRLHRHPRALAHLALAFPEKTDAERRLIALDMWTNLGRVFAEAFMVDRIVAAGRIEDRVAPLLDRLKASHEGAVFVSLHAGNWELVIVPTITAGVKAAGVYQRIKNPIVDRYLVGMRRERYPRGLFQKGAQIGRKLVRIVKDGGAIALLADLRDRRGVNVPFFGHPAPSTTFPALLSRAGQVVMLAARVIRLDGVHFAVEGEAIEVPRTDDRDADVEEATRRIQSIFEGWIREHPEQWMWAHNRWG